MGVTLSMSRQRKNSHDHDISPSEKKESFKNAAAATVIGAGTIVAGAAGYKYGILPDFLDTQIVPQPPTRSEVVEGMVVANEGIRAAAPVVALGAIATGMYYSVAGRLSAKNRALSKLSKTEYSGVDDIQHTYDRSTLTGRSKERVSRFRRGAGIAALAIVLSSATSGVEHEVSNGPLRPIDAVAELLNAGDTDYSMILQDENNTFMDDSVISPYAMREVVEKADSQGITVVPFTKDLMNVNGKSAIEISLPDQVFEELADVEIEDICKTVPVIVDETVGAEVGDTIDINGVDAQVVSVKNDMAQMNRSIAIVSDTDMKACLKDGLDSSYFGAFIPDITPEQAENLLSGTDLERADVVSEADFKENNRDFWRANGTPVLLQLIAYIAIFGGMAAAGERKSALQRNVKEIGIMHASGVDIKDIQAIENRRALSETFRATVLAAPAVPVVAAAFNAAELGMKVGAGPRELAVGSVITLGAKMIASRRAVKSFENNLELSQAVKG